MANEQLSYDDLLQIVNLIDSSEQFSEFRLKIGDIEIELSRRTAASPRTAHANITQSSAHERASNETTKAGHSGTSGQINAADPDPHAPAETWGQDSLVVRSPMVGTFYRAPSPGAPPFVEVGQAVEPDTTVCIVEVMKLMNSIPAGVQGVVTRILVEDAAAVESGQALVVLASATSNS